MIDLATITAAAGTARAALDFIKSAKEAAEKSDNSELLERLNRALTALYELLAKHGELTIEFTKTKAEMEELRARLDEAAKLEQHYSVFWKRREDGSLEGPYSPLYWGRDKKLVLMSCFAANQDGFWFGVDGQDRNISIPVTFLREMKVFTSEQLADFAREQGDVSPVGF